MATDLHTRHVARVRRTIRRDAQQAGDGRSVAEEAVMANDDLAPRLFEDLEHKGDWRVEYVDDDGGRYVTIFPARGPSARPRLLWRPHKPHTGDHSPLSPHDAGDARERMNPDCC
jgi:hypothetical protein